MRNPFAYRFSRRPVGTTPGTGNYAFQPFSTLPLYSPGGPGITYLHGMRGIQEPQMMVEDSQIIDGFEGVGVGDIRLNGLINLSDHLQEQVYLQQTDPLFRP